MTSLNAYCSHMDVGVRELKAHLSAWLERAAAGELIRVTDRGRPVALLGPMPNTERLENGIREGWIRPASGDAPAAVRRVRSRRSVAAVLVEDRGDR